MDFDVKMDDSPPDVRLDVAAGGAKDSVWPGMTIKDILEKVDLFNFTALDDDEDVKAKDCKSDISVNKEPRKMSSNPESAFLGPKIWKNSITLPMLNSGDDESSEDAEFSIMNIDDFLNENNFDVNKSSPLSEEIFEMSMDMNKRQNNVDRGKKVGNQLPKGENGFLYAESKRAKMEREKAERKRKMEVEVEFEPEELALATIPGADFDPKRRHFSVDELRPQPIIRKRKKTYVAVDDKDDKYWERREKNNMAARRSREARRLKENQIALRTAYLEKENAALQKALDKSSDENLRLIQENKDLREALERYETGMLSMN